jgi:hypothetical protein
MTVRELIETLHEFNLDAEIIIEGSGGVKEVQQTSSETTVFITPVNFEV